MDILTRTKSRIRSARTPRKPKDQERLYSANYATRSDTLLVPLGRSVVPDQRHLRRLPQCKCCCCWPGWIEFKKVVEFEDLGIAIYRYIAIDEQDDGGTREIFLIQNRQGSMELKSLSSIVLTKTFARFKTECLQCKKMLERAHRLLTTVPWISKRGVAAVCDHLFLGECALCPSCNAVADKFLSFITSKVKSKRHPSLLLQGRPRSRTMQNDIQIEDAMKSALGIQASEIGGRKKKEDERERQTRKRAASDFQDTAEESKKEEGREKKYRRRDMKEVSKVYHKEMGTEQKGHENLQKALKIEKKDKTYYTKVDIKQQTAKEIRSDRKTNQELAQKALKIGRKDKAPAKADPKQQKEIGSDRNANQKQAEKALKIGKKDKAPAKVDPKQQKETGSDRNANQEHAQKALKTGRKDKASAKVDPKQQKVIGSDRNATQEHAQKAQKIGKKDKSFAKVDSKQKAVTDTIHVSVSVNRIGKKDKQLSKKTSVIKKKKGGTKQQSESGQQAAVASLESDQHITPSSREDSESEILDENISKSKTKNKAHHAVKQMTLMRKLIAQQLKEIQQLKKIQKEREMEKEAVEKAAALAEKRIQEEKELARKHEEAMKMKLNAMKKCRSSSSSSDDQQSLIAKYDGAEEITHMIKGKKICILPAPLPCEQEQCPAPQPTRPRDDTPTPPNLDTTSNATVDGVLRYSLSDRSNIEKGWTELPKETLMRQMTMYHMSRAQPEFDWFELNKHKGLIQYSSGELLAKFDEGRCGLFYKSGELALDYYEANDIVSGKRLVIYSTSEQDAHGLPRPRTVLAMFDYSGNGIVFDHAGNVRLKYNQTEGIILDKSIGPESHWKWHCLNDPPLLRTVITDTHLARKDPTILKLGENTATIDSNVTIPVQADSRMFDVEAQNVTNKQNAKLMESVSGYTPFKIRMKALKINKHFSLKVLDQTMVYIYFSDGNTNLKINIGMVLNPGVIVGQELTEIGEVWTVMDKDDADMESVERLKEAVWSAQANERARVLRDQRLNVPFPIGSFSLDKWKTKLSHPLHIGFISSTVSGDNTTHFSNHPQYYSGTVNS